MRLKLIACEIFYRELSAAVARSTNRVDVEFLPKGLHDVGQAGHVRPLGRPSTRWTSRQYEAVLLGYGLCSNGLLGLRARAIPLVVPRAHDCITLFLGSKERYLDYFMSHPGVYFKTTGWIERGEGLAQFGPETIQLVPGGADLPAWASPTRSWRQSTARTTPASSTSSCATCCGTTAG